MDLSNQFLFHLEKLLAKKDLDNYVKSQRARASSHVIEEIVMNDLAGRHNNALSAWRDDPTNTNLQKAVEATKRSLEAQFEISIRSGGITDVVVVGMQSHFARVAVAELDADL